MALYDFQLIAGIVLQFMIAVLVILTAIVIYKKFFDK